LSSSTKAWRRVADGVAWENAFFFHPFNPRISLGSASDCRGSQGTRHRPERWPALGVL